MHLTGLVHVNINCSDYERSKAFYEMLGFREVWKVPATNSAEVAAAVGMPPYRVNGALLALPGASPPITIDLLEWQDPAAEGEPYAHLYHLGIARLALRTSDLEADIRALREAGIEPLSEPGRVDTGDGSYSRFVCFRDPDGTWLELVEFGRDDEPISD